MRLLWYHVPYPPLGILNITLVAGNDVNMDMQNTLPCRRPYVHTDIVTIGLELLVQQLTFLGYQRHAGGYLFLRQVEKAGDVTTRDDHCMPRAHRVGVAGTVSKFILQ